QKQDWPPQPGLLLESSSSLSPRTRQRHVPCQIALASTHRKEDQSVFCRRRQLVLSGHLVATRSTENARALEPCRVRVYSELNAGRWLSLLRWQSREKYFGSRQIGTKCLSGLRLSETLRRSRSAGGWR